MAMLRLALLAAAAGAADAWWGSDDAAAESAPPPPSWSAHLCWGGCPAEALRQHTQKCRRSSPPLRCVSGAWLWHARKHPLIKGHRSLVVPSRPSALFGHSTRSCQHPSGGVWRPRLRDDHLRTRWRSTT